MIAHLVPMPGADPGHQSPELVLLLRRQFEIVYRPALQANQMVVMTCQPLDQLVASEAVAVMAGQNASLAHQRQ